MKRIIIDYKKLTPELASALLERYPQGYGDEDIIAFKNARGEWVEAVELPTPDALYLVKIGQHLTYLMSHFDAAEAEAEDQAPMDDLEGLDDLDNMDDMDDMDREYDGSYETDLSLEE